MKMCASVFVVFIVIPCVLSSGETKIHFNGTGDTDVLRSGSPPSVMNIDLRSDSAFCPADSRDIILKCMKGLHPLVLNGFPWGSNTTDPKEQSLGKIDDPLDPINYTCRAFNRYQTCLLDRSIQDECLFGATGLDAFSTKVLFNLVCIKEKPSTNLFRSMECLQKTRVVDLMEFHLANVYGSTILDKERQGRRNAYFTFMDSETLLNNSIDADDILISVVNGLVCLDKKHGLEKYIPEIVSRKCGSYAVRLVQSYFTDYRKQFEVAAKKMGLSDICSNRIQVTGMAGGNLAEQVKALPVSKMETTGEFEQFLESCKVGSALDTLFGEHILHRIAQIPAKTMCNITNMNLQVFGCSLASEDKEKISRFNVLLAAHEVSGGNNHGLQCHRLDILRSCWNILEKICGEENVRYFNHIFTVMNGSCGITREMEDVPCEWQDVFYKYYIGASEGGNIWPSGKYVQCSTHWIRVSCLASKWIDKIDGLSHVAAICSKAGRQINALALLSKNLSIESKLTNFRIFIYSESF